MLKLMNFGYFLFSLLLLVRQLSVRLTSGHQFLLLATVSVAAFLACSAEPEHKLVDFSKKVPVAHPEAGSESGNLLRVAVAAMISPKETFIYYQELLDYIGRQSGATIQLIQRKTYDEINQLFLEGQIELAFICTGPYAVSREKYGFEALATPQVRGQPFYQSYLIVHQESPYRNLEDLRGAVFAFTDPDSNTGALVPRHWLSEMGETPESFFKKTIFTYSHDNSIIAVAKGLVDAATVDGHQWEYFQRFSPAYTVRTRVIRKSQPFGGPPVVASARLSTELKSTLRGLLLSMHQDTEGREILEKLLIDRFVAPEEEWYEPVLAMSTKTGKVHHATQEP